MKSRFLFPYKWRKVGVILLVAGLLISFMHMYMGRSLNAWRLPETGMGEYTLHEMISDSILLMLIGGLLLIAFTKEKIEDEQIAQLRLDSLHWAMYFNYAFLILSIIFISDWHTFINIAAHTIFTPLVFFIIRFRWVVYRLNSELKTGE